MADVCPHCGVDHEQEDRRVDEMHDKAKELAEKIMAVVGFTRDERGGFVAYTSPAEVGGAIGYAAGWSMAISSDESFEYWIECVRRERRRTRSVALSKN